MEDYAGNSDKSRRAEAESSAKPPKDIEPVATAQVIVPKKSLGKRFQETFIQTDMKTVRNYVITAVVIPKIRDMIWDGFNKGIGQILYGLGMQNRQPGPGGSLFSYNNIPQQPSSVLGQPPMQLGPGAPQPLQAGPQQLRGDYVRNEYMLRHREEAELVIERMNNIIASPWKVASVADLHQLLNIPHTYVDESWGWTSLHGVNIRQIRDGFVLELPPAQSLNHR